MTTKDTAKKIAYALNDLIVQNYGLDNSMFNLRLQDDDDDEMTDDIGFFGFEGVYGGIEEEFINTIYHILEQEKEGK